MNTKEMLEKIEEKVSSYLETLKEMKSSQDHVSNTNVAIEDIKRYAPNGTSTYGAYIYNLYKDYVEIMTPRTPRYSMWDTPAYMYKVSYEDLSDGDIESLYKRLYKEEGA